MSGRDFDEARMSVAQKAFLAWLAVVGLIVLGSMGIAIGEGLHGVALDIMGRPR